jgi:uncharacterized secreted protein with C-terminal beta-propeller domain
VKSQQFLVIAALVILAVMACSRNTDAPPPVEAGVVIVAVNEKEQYVEIRNDGAASRDLAGWYLSLGRGQTCYLSGGLPIGLGETLRIWALAQDAGKKGYNCGFEQPFWSGKEPERTFLYDASGELVDKYLAGEE